MTVVGIGRNETKLSADLGRNIGQAYCCFTRSDVPWNSEMYFENFELYVPLINK